MKTIIVNKNRHYPCIFKWGIFPKIYYKDFKIEKIFLLSSESYFVFNGEDFYDWSKLLIGLSFGHHQKNESYRFGFRFLDKFFVDLSVYKYVNGKREIIPIGNFNLYTKYKLSISFNKKEKTITYLIKDINDKILYSKIFNINNFKMFGYTLGLYIGGNNTCPKKIKIYYDNKI